MPNKIKVHGTGKYPACQNKRAVQLDTSKSSVGSIYSFSLMLNGVKIKCLMQVLPSLMKLLAQEIVQLPAIGQNTILNQLYQHVAESDDVTRKPTLVSWLQSLSYLCAQGTPKKSSTFVGEALSRL